MPFGVERLFLCAGGVVRGVGGGSGAVVVKSAANSFQGDLRRAGSAVGLRAGRCEVAGSARQVGVSAVVEALVGCVGSFAR